MTFIQHHLEETKETTMLIFRLFAGKESMQHLWLATLLALVSASPVNAADNDTHRSVDVDFENDVQPVIAKYCVSCHGPNTQKANLRMDRLNSDLINGPDAEMWQEVLDLVNVNEMPPKEAKSHLGTAERQILVQWLTNELREAVVAGRSKGGKVIMRRMTVYEYNNTMRDLLGIDLNFALDFPPEGVAKEGFKNNHTVLMTSGLHMEYFAKAARRALKKLIDPPHGTRMVIEDDLDTLQVGPVPLYRGEGYAGQLQKNLVIQNNDDSIQIISGKQYSGYIEPKVKEGFKARNTFTFYGAEVLEGRGISLAGEFDQETPPVADKGPEGESGTNSSRAARAARVKAAREALRNATPNVKPDRGRTGRESAKADTPNDRAARDRPALEESRKPNGRVTRDRTANKAQGDGTSNSRITRGRATREAPKDGTPSGRSRAGTTRQPSADRLSGLQPDLHFWFNDVPTDTAIMLRIKAAAIPGKHGSYPILNIALGSHQNKAAAVSIKEGVNVEIRAPFSAPEMHEYTLRTEKFPWVSGVTPYGAQHIRITNAYRRGFSNLDYKDLPKLVIDSVELVVNDDHQAPCKTVLFDSPNRANENVYIREVLTRFMTRAFRRPVLKSEVEAYAKVFEKFRPNQDSFESTAITTLTAVLCSSHFLLLAEPNDRDSARPLNDYELASRLSYFLWSTMPDETLFELAAKEQLTNPTVLQAQVKRMIKDQRSSEFVKNFTSQWLNLDALHTINVNPEYFAFEDKLKAAFEKETLGFVHTVLQENLSIANFIDSDFAVLSPELAEHYQVSGFNAAGGGFMKVPVTKEHHRGGLLTHASVLLVNSDGGDTHPIKRGVWLLERILDDPPPPPPAVVPDLAEAVEGQNGRPQSLKEKLLLHAQAASCKNCHSKIDPWGVAFENYNALGQWRQGDTDPNAIGEHQKVLSDPSTQLKNGRRIEGLDDLKRYLLNEKREQFTRAVIHKVFSYALGRYVELSDQEAINKIVVQAEKHDLKFQTIIEQIVLSKPFLTK